MLDPTLMELRGSHADTKYVSLFTSKFFSGLETQRSPFVAIDTRYSSRFMGGKPATLIDGLNCEISNRLTLIRRPGLVPFGPSIPPPLAFYPWQRSAPPSLLTVVDTAGALYRYTSQYAGIYFNKAVSAGQTNVYNVINTLYCGDGVDLFKIVGPNLLISSNIFNNPVIWVPASATFSIGKVDPIGGTDAMQLTWGTTGPSASVRQTVSLNYTPTLGNTFTFSIWIQGGAGEQVTLELIHDYTVRTSIIPPVYVDHEVVVNSKTVTLTSGWVKYEVIGTCSSPSSVVASGLTVVVTNPSATTPINVYGAQLEIGGPSTPTEITTTKPQGVWLWGTAGPFTAPTLSYKIFSPPPRWSPITPYPLGTMIVDNNGNIQVAAFITGTGTSGNIEPSPWSTTLGVTTLDNAGANEIGWVCAGAYSAFPTWAPNTNLYTYPVTGPAIVDTNGNVQTVVGYSIPAITGNTEPAWSTTLGGTTVDNAGANQITWKNQGPYGSRTNVGWQYYYSFLNSYTGHPSVVSPISLSTLALPQGPITVSGERATDPQDDKIAIYRNTDGGPFFYQLAVIDNPVAGNWSYTDSSPDSLLNTSIYAPIGLLNSPPPVGLIGMEYHAGRLFGHVGSILYYASGPDNASLLNVTQNGVPSESWSRLNYVPLDSLILRSVSTTAGLLVFTTADIWLITGQDISSFFPNRILRGHGLRSYNALDVDGSTIYAYLSDRQFISLDPSAGSLELGFAVGNLLETTFLPGNVYVARHVSGTQDNAVYLCDGSTGWYRLNPNQVGASLSGEQTPLWSPFSTINQANVGCVASIETSPGVHQLLVGQKTTGPVLTRDITTFADNGSPYVWSATIGSIYLAPSGNLAETESVSVESLGVMPRVSVLLNEIKGSFEQLVNAVNDPPQLDPSQSLNSLRFYLSQGTTPPLCKHLQLQFGGDAIATPDEILSLTIRGLLVTEQT